MTPAPVKPTLCSDNAAPDATELDHQGAVTWTGCPTCDAAAGAACGLGRIGLDILVLVPPAGKVHGGRMKRWLELKAQVARGAGWSRRPNLQQVPRARR